MLIGRSREILQGIKEAIDDLKADGSRVHALESRVAEVSNQLVHVMNCLNDIKNDHYQSSRPSALLPTLWNWKTEPYTTHKRRWEWIDKANSLFRSRCKVLRVSQTSVLCYVLGRFWFKFDGDAGLVQKRLMTEGSWELFLTEALAHEVGPGMTVIDIGANIGYYSAIMADNVGPSGSVYVCEPAPFLRENLQSTFELNWMDDGRIKYCDRPLYSKSNEEVFFVIPKDVKNAHISSEVSSEPDVEVHKMSTLKIDDLIPADQSVDVIKIDAEGAEYEIWKGMGEVIRRSPNLVVFLEFNAGRSYSSAEFLERISEDGFDIQHLHELRGVIDVEKNTLLTENVGSDWILYLSRRAIQRN